MSIIGLVVGLAALFVSALMWFDKKRTDRDREATDELVMNYLLLVARGQGAHVEAGMSKRYVPGFTDVPGFEQPPITVDVVNLIERLWDAEGESRTVTLEEVRSLGSGGLGVYGDPTAAVNEAISAGLVQKRGQALKLTRRGRTFRKVLRYFERSFV